MEVNKRELEDILQCLVCCDHLSASAGGLNERKKYRDQAKKLILDLLRIPRDDRDAFENEMYYREIGKE